MLRILFALCLSLAAGAAAAQDFPSKPIKLVVPFPAGGPNDIIARAIGDRMSQILGQSIIVDNRGGAGGSGHDLRVRAGR